LGCYKCKISPPLFSKHSSDQDLLNPHGTVFTYHDNPSTTYSLLDWQRFVETHANILVDNFFSNFYYRESSNSTDVGAKRNRTIGKSVLIKDCSKMGKIDFQSPVFAQKFSKKRTSKEFGVFSTDWKPYYSKDRTNWIRTIGGPPVLESYPLRGWILGSGAPGTNAVGASGAINGMKRWSVTHERTRGRTDVKVEIVV
jgi:hypothetical protein